MSNDRTYTVGQVLTAAQVNDFPQGLLGKTASSADVGPTSGTTELDIITAPAATLVAGRRIKLTFHTRAITASTVGDTFVFRLKEGATVFEEFTHTAISTSYGITFSAWVDSPTAGSHTYKATVQRTAGTGTVSMSGTGSPIVIAVEDIGV